MLRRAAVFRRLLRPVLLCPPPHTRSCGAEIFEAPKKQCWPTAPSSLSPLVRARCALPAHPCPSACPTAPASQVAEPMPQRGARPANAVSKVCLSPPASPPPLPLEPSASSRPRLRGNRDLYQGKGGVQGFRGQNFLGTENRPPIAGPFDKLHIFPEEKNSDVGGGQAQKPRLPSCPPPPPPAPLPSRPEGAYTHAHSPRGRLGEGGKAPGLPQLCFSLPSLLSFSIMHKFSIPGPVSEY